ncbi:MAG: ribosome maturation factor RimP [Clostridia bacterium]|nr:ribosome maturation factor RimP [Clostridia bacterium]
MAESNIEKKTEELLRKFIEDLGYDLYDVEYLKEGKEYHLCIYIDKEGGIDISDCEKVNEVINPILDKEDYINNQYFLEVSSAGLERKLRKKEHYEKQIGKKIEVSLYSKVDDKKNIQGILREYDKDFLVLQTENKEIKIDIEKVSGAKSVFDW